MTAEKHELRLPTIVWQRGHLRIVARVEVDEDGESVPVLVLERRYADALDNDSWKIIVDPDDDFYVLDLLCCEIASRVELLPAWVRQLVKAMLLEVDEGAAENTTNDAS